MGGRNANTDNRQDDARDRKGAQGQKTPGQTGSKPPGDTGKKSRPH